MRWLITGTLLILGQTAVASTIATDVVLNADGFQFSQTDVTGGLITGSVSGGGETAFGMASLGALGVSASAPGANDDSALADFLDTFSFAGNGNIEVFQNLSGMLSPLGMGTARVSAALAVTDGIPGFFSSYIKQVGFGGNLMSDDGPLVVPVTNGQTLTLLAILRVDVFGSATADYSSTDHVYITPLTPGLQILSASGHDYSVPQSVPEPGSLRLVTASLTGWWLLSRRVKSMFTRPTAGALLFLLLGSLAPLTRRC
jgi:hypothetical protein